MSCWCYLLPLWIIQVASSSSDTSTFRNCFPVSTSCQEEGDQKDEEMKEEEVKKEDALQAIPDRHPVFGSLASANTLRGKYVICRAPEPYRGQWVQQTLLRPCSM